MPARLAELVDPKGNVREPLARERDAPAGFAPDVLATFERAPELLDVAVLHLLERHFAPGLHGARGSPAGRRAELLGDISPRQAAKTGKGRVKIASWLKFLENRTAQQDPGDPMAAYDLTWLWQELSVADLRK